MIRIWIWAIGAIFISSIEANCFLSTTDAIRSTLQNQWSIQLSEQQTDVQAGLLQQAAGAFNLQLGSSFSRLYQVDLQSPLGQKSDLLGSVTQTNVQLQKLSRLGTVYSLNYSNTNTVNPFTIPTQPPRLDTTTIGFNVNQPLMRNLLYSPQATLERTQFLAFHASLYQNVQNIANAVAATLNAYWQVVGNKKILKALIEQEKLLKQFVEYAQKLVDEEQQGSASLHQPLANLATVTQNRFQAEQAVRVAYNNLRLAMGDVTLCEDETTYLCLDFEEIPSLEDLKNLDECCYDHYRDLIPWQRMDVIAAFLAEDIASLNLQSAVNALLPELNLNGGFALKNTNSGPHRSGLYESFPDRFKPEKDYTLGFSLSYPFCNDLARGLVKQTKAQLFQAQINTDQLENQILTSFKTSFVFYNALVNQYAEAVIAAKENRAALNAEFAKLQVGLSSWFDVLGLANDAIASEISEYNIEILYMQNLVQLHLFIGDLIQWDGHSGCMGIADYTQFYCGNHVFEKAHGGQENNPSKGLEYGRQSRAAARNADIQTSRSY